MILFLMAGMAMELMLGACGEEAPLGPAPTPTTTSRTSDQRMSTGSPMTESPAPPTTVPSPDHCLCCCTHMVHQNTYSIFYNEISVAFRSSAFGQNLSPWLDAPYHPPKRC